MSVQESKASYVEKLITLQSEWREGCSGNGFEQSASSAILFIDRTTKRIGVKSPDNLNEIWIDLADVLDLLKKGVL